MSSVIDLYLKRLRTGDVVDLHDELTIYYPRKKIKKTTAEYIETRLTNKKLSLVIILPGFLESVYAYGPTMMGLEGTCDVIAISYSGFKTVEDLCDGIATLLKDHQDQDVYFYATSLGGLIVQFLVMCLVEKHVLQKERVKGMIMSHTAHITGRILSAPSFRAVKNFGNIINYMPKRTLPPIYRARTRLKQLRLGENPYVRDGATDEEILGLFFVYICDMFQASLPRIRLKNYMNQFQKISHLDRKTKNAIEKLLEEIPVLNIFSDTDTVMHHKRRTKAFNTLEKKLQLDGVYGHRNPRYFQLAISDAIKEFISLPLEKA